MARVGVTGHRRLVTTEGLERAIDEALRRIASRFPGQLTVVSPLAEGADRLVVQRALALGHRRFVVPLPLPMDDYVRTFTSTDARAEFQSLLARATEVVIVGQSQTDLEAYRAVGRWVLDHADALIVLWDGQPPRGEGGTGAIVEEARARALPLAWVHTAPPNAHTDALAVSLPEELIVTYERF